MLDNIYKTLTSSQIKEANIQSQAVWWQQQPIRSELSSDTSPDSPISDYNPPKQYWQASCIILYERMMLIVLELFQALPYPYPQICDITLCSSDFMANISSLASSAVWRYLAGAAVLQWTDVCSRLVCSTEALRHQGLCPARIGAQSRAQSSPRPGWHWYSGTGLDSTPLPLLKCSK